MLTQGHSIITTRGARATDEHPPAPHARPLVVPDRRARDRSRPHPPRPRPATALPRSDAAHRPTRGRSPRRTHEHKKRAFAIRWPPIPRTATGALLAVLVSGCGGQAQTATRVNEASTRRPSAPAWQRGTAAPKVTPALIAQAGYGLTAANTNLGTVDEVFGAVPADAHVNPSANRLDDQYARFGRCMGEYMHIHDVGHELALLIAYNRKNLETQAAVEKASTVCAGSAITPDAAYKQSLTTDP
jgi:hypothetical protein